MMCLEDSLFQNRKDFFQIGGMIFLEEKFCSDVVVKRNNKQSKLAINCVISFDV